jgi:hypothetical protein
MKGSPQVKEKVLICKGAGCRAWESEAICRRFKAGTGDGAAESVQILRVACMRQCGGGVSVKAGAKAPVLKMRHPEEVQSLLPLGRTGIVV